MSSEEAVEALKSICYNNGKKDKNEVLSLSWLSTDGSTVTLNGVPYSTSLVCKMESCSYSLGSIFVQVQDPQRSLPNYRKTCAGYGLKDPVKPLYKQAVLKFFYPSSDGDDGAGDDMEESEEEDDDDDEDEESESARKEKVKEDEEKRRGRDDAEGRLSPHEESQHPRGSGSGSGSRDKDRDRDRNRDRDMNRDRSRRKDKDREGRDRDRRSSADRSKRPSSSSQRDKDRDRDKDRRRDRDRDKDRDRDRRGSAGESRRDRDRDKDKARSDSISSASKHHKRDKKDKSKAPMTHQQLLQNLNMVVDKRTANAPTSADKPKDSRHVDADLIIDANANANDHDTIPTDHDAKVTQDDNDIHKDSTADPTSLTTDNTQTQSSTIPLENTTTSTDASHKTSTQTTTQPPPPPPKPPLLEEPTTPRLSPEEEERIAIEQCLICTDAYQAVNIPKHLLEQDEEQVKKIMSLEIPVGNSASVLRCGSGISNSSYANNTSNTTNPTTTSNTINNNTNNNTSNNKNNKRDFSKVLDMYVGLIEEEKLSQYQKVKRARLGDKKHHPNSSSTSNTNVDGTPSRKKIPPAGKPIIIVPNAMTSPVTLLNAHQFFQNSQFVPRDIILKQKSGRKPSSVTIKRKISQRLGGREMEYEIVDNPTTKLVKPRDWDRVVAVVAQGAAWQFKGWKIGLDSNSNNAANSHHRHRSGSGSAASSAAVDIFSNCFGFYIGFEGAPVPKELQGWNVKKGVVSRDKRGFDSVVYAAFWNGLDEWMNIHKSEYFLPVE